MSDSSQRRLRGGGVQLKHLTQLTRPGVGRVEFKRVRDVAGDMVAAAAGGVGEGAVVITSRDVWRSSDAHAERRDRFLVAAHAVGAHAVVKVGPPSGGLE